MHCYKHNLIFVHIPKTAGTSVEWHLIKELGYNHYMLRKLIVGPNSWPWKGPPSKGHLLAQDYVKKGWITQQQWDEAKKFALVRNPYRRLVSAYNGRGTGFRYRLLKRKDWSFREFVLDYFPTILENNYIGSHDNYHHVMPQHKYLVDAQGKMMVENIIKLENIKEELPPFLRSIGLDGALPEQQHVSIGKDPLTGRPLSQGEKLKTSDYYDEDTINFVKKYYQKDFELLGYDPEVLP